MITTERAKELREKERQKETIETLKNISKTKEYFKQYSLIGEQYE